MWNNIRIFAADMTGLVIRTTGSWYRVLPLDADASAMNVTGAGVSPVTLMEPVDCRLRGNYRLRGNKQTNPVAVGDHVEYTLQEDGTGVISEVADRLNYIVRKATKLSKQTHVIAANIDCLCIVASLAPPRTTTGFIDRFLVTAEAYHIPACILFNKADLYDEGLMEEYQDLEAIYREAGYPVHLLSALDGTGIDALRRDLAGQTVLFSGHSGVGKSALLNALAPGLDLRVGDISDWSLKGKHTTTFAEIHPIQFSASPQPSPEGGGAAPLLQEGLGEAFLIDTPGIKEFGMVDIQPAELSHFFPEMRRVLHGCHFANCTHRHEPHCAVKEALEAGTISAERYKNYLGIYDQIVSGNEPW